MLQLMFLAHTTDAKSVSRPRIQEKTLSVQHVPNVLYIIGTIVVANLSTSPIDALDLYYFSVFDMSGERD